MIVVSAVGVVFSIVSFFVPWFTFNTEMGPCRYGLFEHLFEINFPIPLLQSFAFITLLFASATCVLFVLHSLGVIKIKLVYRIAGVVMITLLAMLTFIFTVLVTKQYQSHYVGIPLMGGVIPSIGAWFLLFGAIMSCNLLLFVTIIITKRPIKNRDEYINDEVPMQN